MQLNKPAERQLLDAYHEALSEHIDDPAKWPEFCRVAAVRFHLEFLPTTPQLLELWQRYNGTYRPPGWIDEAPKLVRGDS